MASFAVDGRRQVMVATGIVDAVTEWAEDGTGKRFRTDAQAVSEASGLPLWGVEVTYRESAWGRESTATAKVQVPAKEQPSPGFMTPITFGGLVAEVRVQKDTRALITNWRAEVIESISAGNGAGPAMVAAASGVSGVKNDAKAVA